MIITLNCIKIHLYIHIDSIPYWVKHEPDEEWEETNQKLDTLTNTSDLAYIYVSVISPDYKKRTYVFDTVNQLSLAAGSKVIPFGTVSSLENKDEEYINNLIADWNDKVEDIDE